jgi:hypothetical protein
MATTKDCTGTVFCIVTSWCTATRRWVDLPTRFECPRDAERSATDRGIYRVVCVCEGRRLEMEPFAIIGDD